MRDRAADDGGLLIRAEVARHDLAPAAAAEALDQRPDVVRREHRFVVVDGHGLGDGVRLRVVDPGLPAQELLEGRGAAGAQEAPRFKDSAGHGLAPFLMGGLHCRSTTCVSGSPESALSNDPGVPTRSWVRTLSEG